MTGKPVGAGSARTNRRNASTRPAGRRLLAGAAGLVASTLTLTVAPAHAYTSDERKPDAAAALSAFSSRWKSSGKNDLHGTVKDATTLRWNDRVTSWINQHATRDQRFRALQDAQYLAKDRSGYDQSSTIADGLGERLGTLYLRGRATGKLPLTAKLLNTTDGTIGHYLTTGSLKKKFSYPRPYLPASSKTARVKGDSASCKPSRVNASSLVKLRKGTAWADAKGRLRITRVPAATDNTKRFTTKKVTLDAGYGTKSLCQGGSFPSGHTNAAYAVGITLATLLPELAPSILARASEAGNNRIVLGVHYPLDVIGGRMIAQATVAQRWSDKAFRNAKLAKARTELVRYLESACGAALARCIAADKPYRSDPYAGAAVPGGTAHRVVDRASALAVYTERLGYGFAAGGKARAASVPSKAENLLRTAFPTLSSKQRREVLAQTQVRSGHPLDTSSAHAKGKAPGSWQRLNLAAAMSATVWVSSKGTVTVRSTGGPATVLRPESVPATGPR